jgi:pilus assembly protein Flp/PilA
MRQLGSPAALAVLSFLASRRQLLSQANWEISMNNLFLRRVFDSGRHLLVSEDGPTAVEYAVMLALIVVVCLGTITTIGTQANGTFNTISTALPAAS